MGRTADAADRYASAPNRTAVPTEYARAPTLENPAGATALKILYAMVDHAGPAIGRELNAWHEMPFAPLRQRNRARNAPRTRGAGRPAHDTAIA